MCTWVMFNNGVVVDNKVIAKEDVVNTNLDFFSKEFFMFACVICHTLKDLKDKAD